MKSEYSYHIELRHIYDGTSVHVMHDGTLVNRWKPEDGQRYQQTEAWIAQRMNEKANKEAASG